MRGQCHAGRIASMTDSRAWGWYSCLALRNSRLFGTAASTLAQRATTASPILFRLLKQPKVICLLGQCRQGPDRDVGVRRGKAEAGVGQAPDGLGEVGLLGFRQGPRIGDQIIDGLDPGRVEIAQPTDLNRRWLPCKDRQPIFCGVSGKIYQDVDFVFLDQFGRLRCPVRPNTSRQ